MKTNAPLVALTAVLGWALAQEDDPASSAPEPFTELSTSYTTVTVIASTPSQAPTQSQSPEQSLMPDVPTDGPSCACGATYCGKVLEKYLNYTQGQLVESYCATPGTNCGNYNSSSTSQPQADQIAESLFVCICDPAEPQPSRSKIELLCPCQGRCKNEAPDFISRCETPCNLNCPAGEEEQSAPEEDEPPSSGAPRLRIW
ncbi:hypothetical protein ACRALDRAFT_2053776 [Sodiomyces alcalophilus JCM 7366]|uniref:uncharacterized protein n=1 Tax=Sodiomyces alcalophilus JCM 7366 TaxID=591952 RepID=UPI0039B4F290